MASSESAQQSYSREGAKPCLECHESKKIMGILETPHANRLDPRAPASREQCESCHGPNATHMKFPMQVGNTRFGRHSKTPVAEQDSACLECHHDGARKLWEVGPHGFEKVSCATCHNIHKSSDPILAKDAQAKACTDSCHEPIMTTAPDVVPHELDNLEFTCTACHDPHGPLDLAACTECHPQGAADLAMEPPKARGYHERALVKNIACTDCHKGIVHAIPKIELSLAE